MTATSGRRCIGSWTSSGPLGCLERTLLGSSTWGSTECFLTWRAAATPSGRLLFRLVPSMPRTAVKDYSSSDIETAMGLCPTATVSSGAQTAEDPTPGQTGGTTLWGAARAAMWSTPRAQMERDEGILDRGKHNLGEVTNSAPAVQSLWATPQAFDAVGPAQSQEARAKRLKKGGCVNLREQVAIGTTPSGSKAATASGGGSLNPVFVEWMMGFPQGWTEVE